MSAHKSLLVLKTHISRGVFWNLKAHKCCFHKEFPSIHVVFNPKPALCGCANLLTVLLDFILTSNTLRQSCRGIGECPPGNYMVNVNVLVTMDVKTCKGTQPLSRSKRSFNFLTLFLEFTLTSNALFTYSRNHHSRVSDLLVNVHDTEYLSPFGQITILETSCKRQSFRWSLPVSYESFDCIPYLSWGSLVFEAVQLGYSPS